MCEQVGESHRQSDQVRSGRACTGSEVETLQTSARQVADRYSE